MKLRQRTVDDIIDLILDEVAWQNEQVEDQPLDSDDVNAIIEQLRINLDYREGNLNKEEFNAIRD